MDLKVGLKFIIQLLCHCRAKVLTPDRKCAPESKGEATLLRFDFTQVNEK